MIVVSGVAGHLAQLTVKHLLQRMDASQIVGTSRTPEKAVDLPITVRATDSADPDSLVKGFDGADTVLVVSLPPLPNRDELQANAINAAVTAGAGHIVYTSFTRAGEPANPVVIAPEHRLAEQVLQATGVPFTALRFNMWAEMLLLLVSSKQAVNSGILLSNSGDGGVSYLTKDDSAATAAAVLAEGSNKGELLEVTGRAAISDPELAAALAAATGRPVRHQEASDAEIAASLVSAGAPERMADALAVNGHYRRDGWYETTTHAVRRLTGHEPTSVVDFLTANRNQLLGG